jgi:hypothetical protein
MQCTPPKVSHSGSNMPGYVRLYCRQVHNPTADSKLVVSLSMLDVIAFRNVCCEAWQSEGSPGKVARLSLSKKDANGNPPKIF